MKVNQPYDSELELIAETKDEGNLLKHWWVYGIQVSEFNNLKDKVSLRFTIKNPVSLPQNCSEGKK